MTMNKDEELETSLEKIWVAIEREDPDQAILEVQIYMAKGGVNGEEREMRRGQAMSGLVGRFGEASQCPQGAPKRELFEGLIQVLRRFGSAEAAAICEHAELRRFGGGHQAWRRVGERRLELGHLQAAGKAFGAAQAEMLAAEEEGRSEEAGGEWEALCERRSRVYQQQGRVVDAQAVERMVAVFSLRGARERERRERQPVVARGAAPRKVREAYEEKARSRAAALLRRRQLSEYQESF